MTSSTSLVKYEAARKALAEAHRVDEVKSIRDKAEAMRVYAQQAQNTEMQNMAAEIRLRAERRAGELLKEMEETGQRSAGADKSAGPGRGKKPVVANDRFSKPPTLPELGITRDQSSKWQKVAAIPEEKFEATIASAREKQEEITTAAILRSAASNGAVLTTMSRRSESAVILVEIMSAVKNWSRRWPSGKSKEQLILQLRISADLLEQREAFRNAKVEARSNGGSEPCQTVV